VQHQLVLSVVAIEFSLLSFGCLAYLGVCATNIMRTCCGTTALLAYRRDAAFIYAYFVLRIMIDAGDSGNTCVLLASVGDTVEEKRRGPAFGIILGSLAVGCLMGTTIAKALSVDQVFKVSAPNLPYQVPHLGISWKSTHELYIPAQE
jgi:MFS family permease